MEYRQLGGSGLYVPALATIKQMMNGDFHNVWLILLLLAGVIVGVFLSLGGIKKMLEQHRSAAMYAILGMMVASLYAIVMGPMTLEDPKPAMSVATVFPRKSWERRSTD